MSHMSRKARFAKALRRVPFLLRMAQSIWRSFQGKYSLGVVGVILNQENQVLLVEHVFHPKKPWGLPGGWVDRNEEPNLTIVRELKEELALDVIVTRTLLYAVTFRSHLDIAFLCESSGVIGALSYELLQYKWFDIDNLPEIRDFHVQAIQAAVGISEEPS